jgi:hypothetical protein
MHHDSRPYQAVKGRDGDFALILCDEGDTLLAMRDASTKLRDSWRVRHDAGEHLKPEFSLPGGAS